MRSIVIGLLALGPIFAQSNTDAMLEGKQLYRSNCAFCHGLTGGGGRGPALANGRYLHGNTASDIARVVSSGVPGTNMPAFEMEDEELDRLVLFVRSFSTADSTQQPVAGNAVTGREIYSRSGCPACHRIAGEGSVFGPDLTRIGAARSAAYLRESILNPSADIPPEFEGVTAITRDGRRIAGLRVNEDTFTLQLRDSSQQFHMFNKSDLREVTYETKSLMPSYASLKPRDLQNLLAYLDSLRGARPTAVAASSPAAVVPYDRIVNALQEPRNWLTYWGDYTAIRHRNLRQIHTGNVKDLRAAWLFQTGVATATYETVPLVVDGIMYITAAEGNAFALDARTGRQLWHYKYTAPPGHRIGLVNRGFAILDNLLYMVTSDACLIALDARTGREAWQTEMVPYKNGAYFASLAPLALKDKVIVGISGGEQGVRGFLDAYDAKTGRRAWRFWTVPGKGEPGSETWDGDSWKIGGGPTWMTGTFDPTLNTLYWEVGNPGADLYGDNRRGDNLYTCSLLALDPDTGRRKWHFQFTPHDTHDWDAQETPMLLDLKWQGHDRKLVLHADRNAFYYVLDRETGEFLMGKPFARQTWAKGLDAKGRPIVLPNTEPTPEGNRQCPGLAGATNWMAPSYNPQTGLFYFAVREQCDVYYSSPPKYIEGKAYWGSVFRGVTDEKEWGLLKAMDPLTGETKWNFRYYRAPWAGTLSTSGGLIFAGDEDGYLMAFDAVTGANLWKFNTGNRLIGSPIAYMVDGRQFIAMPSGAAMMAFALPE